MTAEEVATAALRIVTDTLSTDFSVGACIYKKPLRAHRAVSVVRLGLGPQLKTGDIMSLEFFADYVQIVPYCGDSIHIKYLEPDFDVQTLAILKRLARKPEEGRDDVGITGDRADQPVGGA